MLYLIIKLLGSKEIQVQFLAILRGFDRNYQSYEINLYQHDKTPFHGRSKCMIDVFSSFILSLYSREDFIYNGQI